MAWPLIERELRGALRRRQLLRVRFWGTLGCAALAGLFLLTSASAGKQNWGREFNSMLFFVGLILIAQVPSYTVGLFAEERRNDTLGLLFLCGIRPLQLFLGKTLGAGLVSVNRLLLLYPFLAIAFLSGGLSWQMFVATTCSLPVLLAFVFATCVFASVLCREESAALFLAVVLGGLICFAVPLLDFWLGGGGSFQTALRWGSPAYAPFLAADRLQAATLDDFLFGLALSGGWTIGLLAAAAVVLAHIWRDQPKAGGGGKGGERFTQLMRGQREWRRQIAERWFSRNPFVWLAIRDRWPASLAWFVWVAGVSIWVGAALLWPDAWFSPAGTLVTVLVINYALSWIVRFAAARTIGECRRSGALELLLTTPLSHLDLVRGQLVALREQFAPVARALLLTGVGFMVGGLLLRRWSVTSLVIYLVSWTLVLGWTAAFAAGKYRSLQMLMWDALVCGRPAYVVMRQAGLSGNVAVWVYLFLLLGPIIRTISGPSFGRYPSGTVGEGIFVGFGFLAWFLMWRGHQQRLAKVEDRLAISFRYVATVPVPEPSDPRYKEWRSGEPFPETLTDYLIGRVLQQVAAREAERKTPRREKLPGQLP